MPPYDFSEPDVLNFIVLPLVIVALFVWGVAHAWRRTGATHADARSAAIVAAALRWFETLSVSLF